MSSRFYLKAFLFFTQSAGMTTGSFIAVYLVFRGLSAAEIGLVLAAGKVAMLIANPVSGYMSDRLKTIKRLVLTGAIFMTAFGALMFSSQSFEAILLLYFLFSFSLGPVVALGESLAQKTANDMKLSFGSFRMWGSLGAAIAVLGSGLLLSLISIHWIILPFLFFCVFLIGTALKIEDVVVSTKPVKFSDTLLLLKNRSLFLFLASSLFVTIAHRANDDYIALFITEMGGNESLIGWAWFIGIFTEFLVFSWSYKWYRQYHPLTFTVIAAVLYGVRYLVMSFVYDPYILLLLQPLHGITFGILYTAAFDYVTRIVPKELQSTGHVLLSMSFFGISGIIAALGGGFVIEHFSTHTLFEWIGYLSLFSALLLVGYSVLVRRGSLELAWSK
ncbi:MFS transporter [Bacillus coahuilensis]|uniref:MFS transporter n=1 Tax=Bacillus coahuilensis TaxID=408580 RepID=UPI000750EFFC|nr:MFS transporter [Bacillus coahuilensis]